MTGHITDAAPMRATAARRPGRPSRDTRLTENTRATIIAAALALFAERGFDGASMRDIAARAQVDHSLLRYYFGDKSRLWRDAVAVMIDRLSSEMSAVWTAGAGQPLIDRFKSYLRAYVRYCARHPEHARIMVQESMKPSDRVAWIIERGIRDQHGALMPVLSSLIRMGHLPDIPLPSLIYSLSATAQTYFMLASEVSAAHGVDPTAAAEVDRHADALIALFVRD